jgi:hypothetical protein
MITTLMRRSVSVRQATFAASMSPRRARADGDQSAQCGGLVCPGEWSAGRAGSACGSRVGEDPRRGLGDLRRFRARITPGQRGELAAQQQLSRAEPQPAPASAVATVVLTGCWGEEGSSLGITRARRRRDDQALGEQAGRVAAIPGSQQRLSMCVGLGEAALQLV